VQSSDASFTQAPRTEQADSEATISNPMGDSPSAPSSPGNQQHAVETQLNRRIVIKRGSSAGNSARKGSDMRSLADKDAAFHGVNPLRNETLRSDDARVSRPVQAPSSKSSEGDGFCFSVERTRYRCLRPEGLRQAEAAVVAIDRGPLGRSLWQTIPVYW